MQLQVERKTVSNRNAELREISFLWMLAGDIRMTHTRELDKKVISVSGQFCAINVWTFYKQLRSAHKNKIPLIAVLMSRRISCFTMFRTISYLFVHPRRHPFKFCWEQRNPATILVMVLACVWMASWTTSSFRCILLDCTLEHRS